MKRSRFIFIVAFLLAMSAGAVLGALWAKLPVATGETRTNPERHGPEWLPDQLHLRPDQKAQMDAIWAEMHSKIGKAYGEKRALEKERDEACKALLTDDQRAAWDKIRQDYRPRIDEANPPRDSLVRDAEARTRALLDPDQQKRWDELTKKMHEHHRGPGPGPGPGGSGGPGMPGPSGFHGSRGDRSRSSTQPGFSATTQPSNPPRGQVQNTDQPRP
jgi:hypothetical protein